jgi:hypothetical protein
MITEFSYHFRKLDVEDKPKKSKVPKTLKLINVKTKPVFHSIILVTNLAKTFKQNDDLLSCYSINKKL